MSGAELIVVQDPYHPTETTQFADVLLPVAQWAEKTGTMTSSERLVSFSEQVVKPPGTALPDWQIRARFGESLFGRFPLLGISRPEAATPASGALSSHRVEQERLLSAAFGGAR